MVTLKKRQLQKASPIGAEKFQSVNLKNSTKTGQVQQLQFSANKVEAPFLKTLNSMETFGLLLESMSSASNMQFGKE